MTSISRQITGNKFLSESFPSQLANSIDRQGYLALGEGAYSTEIIDEPVVYAPVDEDQLDGLMEDDIHLQSALEEFFNPTVLEPGEHVLATEADVERAAHSHLIHGIVIIFQGYLDKRFPGQGKRLLCGSQVQRRSGRTDESWSVDGINIAVLEVKNCEALRKSDWTPYILPIQLAPRYTLSDKADEIYDKSSKAQGDDFKAQSRESDRTNRVVLSKQTTKYTKTHRTPVVVLFDWLTMILFDFEPKMAEEHKPDWSAEQWSDDWFPVEILFARDKASGWNMRKTLLAALFLGYDRCFNKDGTPIAGRPTKPEKEGEDYGEDEDKDSDWENSEIEPSAEAENDLDNASEAGEGSDGEESTSDKTN
ncbi:hypothetical protein R3P38DRAFT_2803537 [Favolaschia claudopus]|uniref:Uncharacterized protein n=1 Tax=Favolaschia claudopus TaxID=2862362 RepID=A0AAV9ZSA3_9AGAR